MGMVFTGVTYYDGIQFLVDTKLGVSAKDLDGATIHPGRHHPPS